MHKISMASRTFAKPTRVVLEASLDAILELRLDSLEGEQFDALDAVISIEVTPDVVKLETVRTIEAYQRGEANAGRGVRFIPRAALEALHIAD